jgi:hypothetical protein
MSKAAFSAMVNKGGFRVNTDLIRIADAIGYDVIVQLRDRETGNQLRDRETGNQLRDRETGKVINID